MSQLKVAARLPALRTGKMAYSTAPRRTARLLAFTPVGLSLLLWITLCPPAPAQTPAQSKDTKGPGEPPANSPIVEETLPSYEGQNVSSVELAGRPDLNPAEFEPLLVQKAGQPFSMAKIN